jgi:hypothetical protein
MTAEVHQKIHRKLELKYSHIEPQHTIDPLRVRALLLAAAVRVSTVLIPSCRNTQTRALARRFIAPCIRGTNISCGKKSASAAAAIQRSRWTI